MRCLVVAACAALALAGPVFAQSSAPSAASGATSESAGPTAAGASGRAAPARVPDAGRTGTAAPVQAQEAGRADTGSVSDSLQRQEELQRKSDRLNRTVMRSVCTGC